MKNIQEKKLIKKFFLLLIATFSFIVLIFEILLSVFNESINLKNNFNDYELIGVKYKSQFYELQRKSDYINYAKPEIILLGSSTLMQANKKISRDKILINASVGNISFGMMNYFIDKLNYEPEIIIISLDSYLFDQNYYGFGRYKKFTEFTEKNLIKLISFARVLKQRPGAYKEFILDLIKYRNEILNLTSDDFKKYFGFNAIVLKSGFKKDGSFQYPNLFLLNNFEDRNSKKFLVLIEQNSNKFFNKNMHFEKNFKIKIDEILKNKKLLNTKKIFILNALPPELIVALKEHDHTNKFYLLYDSEICKYINNYKDPPPEIKCFNFINAVNEYKIKNYKFFDEIHMDENLINLLVSKVLE
jgi:hypothetical protein